MPKETGSPWQIILNPHAGGSRGAHDRKKIEELLHNSGISFELKVSEYPGHAIEIARDLVSGGAKRLIVAGGDGTLNEVVNGIFQADVESNHQVTLGMLPVGTGNDWIKTFGIPDHYQKAIDIILEHKTVLQDVGEITCHSGGETTKRYFVNIAGFGFDALTAGKANRLKLRGITGIRVYIQSLLAGYFEYNSLPVRITMDGKPLDVNLFSASIGLGKFNGGGMMQVPEANPLKGLFHITVIRKIGIWGILTNFMGLYSGEFIRDRRVSTHTGREILLESNVPLPGESDGESLPSGTFRISMIAHRLQVIYGDNKFLGNLAEGETPGEMTQED